MFGRFVLHHLVNLLSVQPAPPRLVASETMVVRISESKRHGLRTRQGRAMAYLKAIVSAADPENI